MATTQNQIDVLLSQVEFQFGELSNTVNAAFAALQAKVAAGDTDLTAEASRLSALVDAMKALQVVAFGAK